MDIDTILKYIPPTNIALLIVIYFLFKCIEKKDKLLQDLSAIIHRNSEVTSNLSTLINFIVQGRRD